jgi:AcrR family transcriptional regulator
MHAQPNRRERRKQRTREAIQVAALELFAERGYRETTISAIADQADVAPRTVTIHFPTKEELLFGAEPFSLDSLIEALEARGPKQPALEALRAWMAETIGRLDSVEADERGAFWRQRALRVRIINAEPELRGRARAAYHEFERVLAEAIGKDLAQPGTALVPRLAALTAVTGLRELYESDEAQALGPSPAAASLLRLVDRVIAFARAGVERSTDPAAEPGPVQARDSSRH